MAGHVVTAKERLASAGPSRKILLSVFEFEAIAYALRFGLREKLVPEEARAKAFTLAGKLEKYRERAKRATIKAIGLAAYKQQAKIWHRFLLYMRSILCLRPVFLKSKALPLMHRNGREKLFEYAKAVAPTADPSRLKELVILAKREVLRDCHPVTFGMLVSDEKLGRRFMADFILNREDPHVLAKEFQSLDIIQSERAEKLKAALVLDDFDEPAETVTVIKPSAELHPDIAELPILVVPALNELTVHFVRWLIAECIRGDWEMVTGQTRLWIRHYHEIKYPLPSTTLDLSSSEFRPNYAGDDTGDLLRVFGGWGATRLLSQNADPRIAGKAAADGLRLAIEWDRMGDMLYSHEKAKLDAIYLRSRP